MEKRTFIVVHESVAQAWMKDLGTFLTLGGLIGMGWLIGSEVMQYVGALLAMIALVARHPAASIRANSIDELHAIADRIESEGRKGE